MDTATYLRHQLPSEGLICIAHRPMGQKGPWTHETFETFDKAGAYVDVMVGRVEVFNATHTFKALAPGQKFKRSAEFALACRVICTDLDVKPGDPKAYASKADAMAALDTFLATTGWPRPTINDSGNGYHIYWRLAEAIPSEVWVELMAMVRAVFDAHGLKYDPAVMGDRARVLRPINTQNNKDLANPLPVFNVHASKAEPVEVWHARLAKAAEQLPDREVADTVANAEDKPTPMGVVKRCRTFLALMEQRTTVDEPRWYTMLQLANWTTGGRAFGLKLSEGHPTFKQTAFDKKWAHASRPEVKPPTCGKLGGFFEPGPDHPCRGCINEGLFGSSPIVLARKKLEAVALPATLPPPQPPWYLNSAGVFHQAITQPGQPPAPRVQVLSYVLVPNDIIEAEETQTRDTHWVATVKAGGITKQRDIVVPAGAIGNDEKMAQILNNAGVFTERAQIKKVGSYMSYYIKQLQALQAERPRQKTLGWSADYKKFYLGDEVITATGTETAVYAPSAEAVLRSLGRAGTLQGSVEALRFYNRDAYMAQQAMICAGLGAPLLYKLDLHGIFVTMFGNSGASKSSCLYGMGSQWAHPLRFIMNGTRGGSTQKARLQRLHTLAHVPAGLDDVSDVEPRDLQAMVMSMTQPNERSRLNQSAVEVAGSDVLKSSILLGTSNPSMHQLLAQTPIMGEAASMRCVEFHGVARGVHTMLEADGYKRAIIENHGWVGPEFIRWCLNHEKQVDHMIAAIKADLIREGNMTQQERFWLGAFVIMLLAADIAKRNGWLDYDVAKLRHFLIHEQLPYMRARLDDHYLNAVGILKQYLSFISTDVLVLDARHGNADHVVAQAPRNLRARYEPALQQMWIGKQNFREYIALKHKSNDTAVISELIAMGVVHDEKMDLGRNTYGWARSQIRALRIDLSHAEMGGLQPAGAPVGNVVPFKAVAT